MNKKDEVPMDIQLTIESGILCCKDFSEFHEWVEKLLGHPIWTHEFPGFALDFKIALIIRDEGYIWTRRRTKGPLETLMERVPIEKIIAIVR
jgi:hypothetical protein